MKSPVCYSQLKFPSCRVFLAGGELLKRSGLSLREIWHRVGVNAKWWLTQQQNDVHLLCSGLQCDDLRSVRKHLSPSPHWISARTQAFSLPALFLPPADGSGTRPGSFITLGLDESVLMSTQYERSCTTLKGGKASEMMNFLFKVRVRTV